jgi:hypothetical protein
VLCASPPPPLARGSKEQHILVEPKDDFTFLRNGLREAEAYLALERRAARLYPRVVWRRLLDGERVAMRAAEARLLTSRDDHASPFEGLTLQLKVFSGTWTGSQVEDEVRRQAPQRLGIWDSDDALDGRLTSLHVDIRFTFVAAEEPSDWLPEERDRGAYILVEVPIPLPPVESIAREYDGIVRGTNKWHESLPGVRSIQDNVVALRTWSVGLLMSDGASFAEAMASTSRRLNVLEVTQTRFGQDRKRLLERVPEAETYLFVRQARALPLANADSQVTTLQASPEDQSA